MTFSLLTDRYRSLVTKAKSGDEEAFRTLFEKTHQKLFLFAAARTKRREDATDIVEDTFVDLWQALPDFEYRSDRAFLAFLFIILKRKLARYYQQAHEVVEFDEQMATTPAAAPHDEYGLDKLVPKLRPEYREVLELRYWSDLPFAYIAEVMEQNLNTIKTWHRRALSDLQALIKDHD